MLQSSSHPVDSPLDWSALEIASEIAAGQISAREVTQAYIDRIEAVNGYLNAMVVKRFEQALCEAAARDERQALGAPLAPMHGVPFTVKECFHVAGTPATIGLTTRRNQISPEDGLLVRRWKQAGGICLGKTNVPQLMLLHECDNPVYGRTNNPWDVSRTSGGSTGGEAALIAARGSPLGLGNDLGGSIRMPVAFCGIHGIKPTSRILPREGSVANFRGMTSLQSQAGTLARSVDDLEFSLGQLCRNEDGVSYADASPVPLRDSRKVAIRGMRVGYWSDDGIFPPSAAVRRVVEDAAQSLAEQGAELVRVVPPFAHELFDDYLSLIAADGGADGRRLLAGSDIDWRVSRMLMLKGLSSIPRAIVVAGLRAAGQPTLARMVSLARPLSVDGERQIYWRVLQNCRKFLHWQAKERISAFLSPPYALPAPPHKLAIDLVAAASYTFLPNILGFPAGVVSLSRVRPEEESGRKTSRDLAYKQAWQTDQGSAGLPVAVQVMAAPWREDITFAVMRALEESFRGRADYPPSAIVPAAISAKTKEPATL